MPQIPEVIAPYKGMTVRQLMNALSRFDPDLPVYVEWNGEEAELYGADDCDDEPIHRPRIRLT